MIQKPRVFIVTQNHDVNNLVSGVLWLKGIDPYKFFNADECLERFRRMDGNVDVILMSDEIAK